MPARLLLLALPLIIALGGLLAFVFFPEEKIGFALLIGAILAPTDAALGLSIFSNKRVPVRIRRALNDETVLALKKSWQADVVLPAQLFVLLSPYHRTMQRHLLRC